MEAFDIHALLTIIIAAVVTAAIRFSPFIIFNGKRQTPAIITYLGKVLPYAIMGMLVIFCYKDITFDTLAGFLPSLIAGALVVVLYLLKKNTLLSIVGGTACYMIIVQLGLFA